MNNIIEDLTWRYATKEFDTEKKLSQEQIDLLLSSTNLTATSLGLQPYKVVMVENIETREKLKQAAWNQSQVTDASHILIFAAYTNTSEEHVENLLNRITSVRKIPREALAEYEGMMKGFLNKPKDELFQWASKQTYIALGNILNVCAQAKIDACPMEGFDHKQFDKILGLEKENLSAAVMVAVGYRSANDNYQHLPKVRKSLKEFVLVR